MPVTLDILHGRILDCNNENPVNPSDYEKNWHGKRRFEADPTC